VPNLNGSSSALVIGRGSGLPPNPPKKRRVPSPDFEFYFSTGPRSCSRRQRAKATLLGYVHVGMYVCMYYFDHYLPYLGTQVVPTATAGKRLLSTLCGKNPLLGKNPPVACARWSSWSKRGDGRLSWSKPS